MSRTMLVAIAAVIALSGCTESAQPTQPSIVTSPTDYEYLNNQEPGSHVHDYWGGKQALDILEANGTRTPLNGFGFNIREYEWYPEPDMVIPQGTVEVRVTIDWTSDTEPTHTPPELHYKTAALRNWTFADFIESGKTIVIPTNGTHNDVPHQRLSAWGFSLWYDGDGPLIGWTVKSNQVHVKVEAVRGDTLPAFPAHPDQWDNRSSIDLFSWDAPSSRWMVNGICLNACSSPAEPLDGAIVPFDAAYVEARLTVDTSRNAAHMGDLDLTYHGSDTREWTLLEPDRSEGNVHYYYIQIDGQADGPYSQETQWQFHVANDQESPNFQGYYRIDATVHRYEMPF